MHRLERLLAGLDRETDSSEISLEDEGAQLIESLTRRQRQILAKIAKGMSSAEIARELGLSTNTVITHRRELLSKLNLHRAADITRFAMRNGLVDE